MRIIPKNAELSSAFLMTMKQKQKNQKPLYRRVRLPKIVKIGGAYEPAKGGKHRRSREKEKTRKEVETELK